MTRMISSIQRHLSASKRLLMPHQRQGITRGLATPTTFRRPIPRMLVPACQSNWKEDSGTAVRLSRRSMVMVTKTSVDDFNDKEEIAAEHKTSIPQPQTDEGEGSSIIITDACWKQILRLAARKSVTPTDIFLRMYVDAGGCSGFEYKFEVETDPLTLEDDDVVWEGPEGARVVVDESSLEFVKGATLDYVEEMIKSAFTVKDNPLSESACGCGSSFAVKNFSTNPALD